MIATPDQLMEPPARETPGPVGTPFVLRTRGNQERAVVDFLAARGIEHFLPMRREVRGGRDRVVVAEVPLFPGYVFMWGDTEDCWAVERTRRIAQVLPVTDPRGFEAEIAGIRQAAACDAPLEPHPFLREGVRVRVIAGPMRGVCGVVESRARMNRLFLQIKALGRAATLEIDGSLLEILA